MENTQCTNYYFTQFGITFKEAIKTLLNKRVTGFISHEWSAWEKKSSYKHIGVIISYYIVTDKSGNKR